MTSPNTAARNRRQLHQQRINDAPTDRWKLAQAWAWLYAELIRRPDQIDRAVAVIRRHADRLNTTPTTPRRRRPR